MARFNTDTQVRNIRHPDAGQVEYWDKSTPGLCLRVGRATKSFILFYRFDGKQRRETLGRYNEEAPEPTTDPDGTLPKWGRGMPLSLKTARRVAAHIQELAAVGHDPRGVRDDAKEKRRRAAGYTYAKAVEQFYKEHLTHDKQNVTRDAQRSRLLRAGRNWLDRPVAGITFADIRADLKACVARGHRAEAKERQSVLSVFFDWLAVEQLIPENIMRAAPAPAKYVPKKMPPWDDAEIKALWECADRLGGYDGGGHSNGHTGAYLRLLMLLGQRPNEVAKMRWDELNLDADSTKVWPASGESMAHTLTLRPGRHKAGHHSDRTVVIPLTVEVVRILKSLPRVKDNPYVFPGRGAHDGSPSPATVNSKLQGRIQKLSGVERFTFQNARRTVATGLSRFAVPPHIIAACLHHAPATMADKHYSSYLYIAEQREAFEKWVAHIEEVTAEPEQPRQDVQEARV